MPVDISQGTSSDSNWKGQYFPVYVRNRVCFSFSPQIKHKRFFIIYTLILGVPAFAIGSRPCLCPLISPASMRTIRPIDQLANINTSFNQIIGVLWIEPLMWPRRHILNCKLSSNSMKYNHTRHFYHNVNHKFSKYSDCQLDKLSEISFIFLSTSCM